MAKLSPLQQRFCEEYVVDLNATKAVIRAGYSEKGAHVTGNRLLSTIKVQEQIQVVLAERAKRTGITADRVLEEYRRIAMATTDDVIHVTAVPVFQKNEETGEFVTDEDGNLITVGMVNQVHVEETRKLPMAVRAAISEIKQTKDGISVKFHSKTAALDALAKHLGINAPDVHKHIFDTPPPVFQMVPAEKPKVEAKPEDESSDAG